MKEGEFMMFIVDRVITLTDVFLSAKIKTHIDSTKFDVLKNRLKEDMQKLFLEEYGTGVEQIFFGDLDDFFVRYNVVDKFIAKSCDVTIEEVKSSTEYFIDKFFEDYPNYKTNHKNDIINAIKFIDKCIFETLNKTENHDFRVAINKILQNLSPKLNRIENNLIEIKNDVKKLQDSIGDTENYSQSKLTMSEDYTAMYESYVEMKFEKQIIGSEITEMLLKSLKTEKVVLILGHYGIGKTTLSFMIAEDFKKSNPSYKLGYLESSESLTTAEISDLLDSIKKSRNQSEIIIFDDFLGKTNLNDTTNYLDRILDFIKMVKNMKTKKVILTSRLSIFNDAKTINPIFDEIFLNSVDYNLENKYTPIDKINIIKFYFIKNDLIENNLKFVEFSNDKVALSSIINHANFTPLIIERAVNKCTLSQNKDVPYFRIIRESLENPKSIWAEEFNALNENAKNYLFILCSLSDTFVDKETVKKCYEKFMKTNSELNEDSQETLERIDALIITSGESIRFKHHSISEYLFKKISKIREKIIANAEYIEQIERLDQTLIKELLLQPNKFFEFKILPIRFANSDLPMPNSIAVPYLKYIVKYAIKDKKLESTIAATITHTREYGFPVNSASTDDIIDILYMKFYDIDLLSNSDNVESLYRHVSYENLSKLLELTYYKDAKGYNFKKMESSAKEQILDRCSDFVAGEVYEQIESVFFGYLSDYENLEEYEIDDVIQEILFDIESDLEIKDFAVARISEYLEENHIYNFDANEIDYDFHAYSDFIMDNLLEYFQKYY